MILSSSPRKGGNSEKLATAFAKGVEEMGNHVEIVYLREKQYSFCKGCFACQKLGLHDEFLLYLQKACEINPQEARYILKELFPNDCPVSNYVNYARQHHLSGWRFLVKTDLSKDRPFLSFYFFLF